MLVTLAALAIAQSTGEEMRLMRYPTIHGDQVVFTYAGDLWTASTKGGNARRLTSHPGPEQWPFFSPDGKWIAFSGAYDGNLDAYVMPSDGGEPKRLTYNPANDLVRGWTPDGKIAYVTDQDTPGGFSYGLRLVSPQGGLSIRTKLDEAFDVSFSPDGNHIAYDRNNSHAFNWRRYRGGTQGRIAFSDVNATTYSEIPSGRENRWQPMWIGDKVYYICDKTLGTRNLWVYDTKTKAEKQLTNFNDADIKWPSTDGATIVFERNGFLCTYTIANGKVETLSPRLGSDLVSARPQMKKLGASIQNFSLSPSGARIAVETRGELFSLPARSGETRPFGGDSSSKEHAPAWSPDGKTIAFMSDKSGEDRIYTMPQMGGDWTEVPTPKEVKLTAFHWSPDAKKLSIESADKALYVYFLDSKKMDLIVKAQYSDSLSNYDWSPDANWIAYIANGKNLFGATFLYDVNAKKSTQITEGYYRDDQVAFDNNGKYLYILSARTFNPTPGAFEFDLMMTNAQRVYVLPLAKTTPNPMLRSGDEEPSGPPEEEKPTPPGPMKIDLDGLGNRALPLPWPADTYGGLIGINNGVLTLAEGTLVMYDFNSRAPQVILPGVQALDINPGRNKIAYVAGGALGITDLRPGIEPGTGRVNLGDVQAVIDPRKEWRQIFWEAWRWERDRFYDKSMLGLDWMAIGRQYEKFLPYVGHRSDLNYVIGLMIGELGTGHAYVSGGDPGVTLTPIPVGTLGADYEVSSEHIRFKKIFRGQNFEEGRRGPLGDPAITVNEGEYLLAIDGEPIGKDDPNSHLVGKANRRVTLTVNVNPTMEGARKVSVRTIADENGLRYIDWVESNRRKVAELSGGRIGYMHVPNTSEEGMVEFTKGYYSQSDKDAIIVDERYNGGGMIPTFFIEKLARKYMTAFKQRNGLDIGMPVQAIEGPKAMLINEFAGSGGDLFPWFFREAKLGPLIGNRTWGGLVGITGDAPLVDGGGVSAPEFGLYDMARGEWIAENKGIDPDIQVDLRPDLVAQGHDPQLEKAVDYLLGELKKGGRKIKVPDYPKVKKGGGK